MSNLKMENCLELRNFRTLSEFVNYCDSVQTVTAWKGDTRESITGSNSFTQTLNYETASKLAKTGWGEGVSQVRAAVNVKVHGLDQMEMKKANMDIVGAVPIVPAYLSGDPECMWNPAEKHVSPVINIVIDLRCAGMINTEYMVNRGAAILRLAGMIEQAGQRVRITMCDVAKEGKYWHAYFVCIKQPQLTFNFHALSYAIVHPSMLRRHGFKVTENLKYKKGQSDRFQGTYGYPANMTEIEGVQNALGDVDLYFERIQSERGYRTVEEGIKTIWNMAREQGVIQ